ncbi:MAG: XRE family transcriptional regulator [Coriobacteriia bacterium]|nr:XRE family transcriptional regulator [Coriobacteriia bacterium]
MSVGAKLATLRESHGLSQEELANRSGCELATIVAIENGSVIPSLAPLIQLTRALGVRLGTILDDDKGLGPVVTTAAALGMKEKVANLETGTADAPLDFYSLAEGKITRHMNPFLIDVAPNQHRDLDTHEGEEFIHVMDGLLEIEYGKDTFVLEPGDSIYYDSIVPHQVRCAGDEPTRILACVYAPA